MTALTVGPAYAVDSACSGYQDKTFSTPGSDVHFAVNLCIEHYSEGGYEATAYYTWSGGGGTDLDDNRKFDQFDLQVRVEQHDPDLGDIVKASRVCDLRYDINTSSAWSGTCGKWYSHSRALTWSADGTVTYDIDRDGKGALPAWNLGGSARID
ncbi:hypothetical protein [Streptomyces sp. NPDC002588]|uniref:hypothetical protein n=1 Tax=Streptomyces sp. NPDC002588 TaxID=3154419 RepID=UPI00332CD086